MKYGNLGSNQNCTCFCRENQLHFTVPAKSAFLHILISASADKCSLHSHHLFVGLFFKSIGQPMPTSRTASFFLQTLLLQQSRLLGVISRFGGDLVE